MRMGRVAYNAGPANVMFVGLEAHLTRLTIELYPISSYIHHKPKREIVVIWPNLAIINQL
jgi:hypothetical protein